ncbi:MAG: DEAD/DEAH box helicase [Candidatus Omnitrophota bacterium]
MIYDAFQKNAISCAEKNQSVIVYAPTGAGKTAIAEHIITQCIAQNQQVIYTSPIKALSNQKFRDFTAIYGEKVGILTGDVSINAHAPVLIMTTEIFRNCLLEDPQRFSRVAWLILDEVHYLDDPERGTVWEESIIFCPTHIRFLALSATIPNTKEIAAWISKIHKQPIQAIVEQNRPVPLHHSFQCNNRIFSNFGDLAKNCVDFSGGKSGRKKSKYFVPNKISSLIQHLKDKKQLPAIYFAFSRKRCEELAFKNTGFNFLSFDEKRKLEELFSLLLKKFGLENEPSAKKLWPLVKHGIAYHHAGLLPSLKEVIERLFTSRLIKMIFTTETFALGINMPAKTVVFDELKKFYGYSYAVLRSRDYYQIAGRAGRRGIDSKGFVYCRINLRHIQIKQLKQIILGQPEPIISQFNISYATLLHLYKKWHDQLYAIYPLTLHFFQSAKRQRHNALSLLRLKIKMLKDAGYIQGSQLTVKGIFASFIYGYELPMAELYAAGILEKLSSIDLNIVLAALVFEPRKNQLHVRFSHDVLKIHRLIFPVIKNIVKKEQKYHIYPLSKEPNFFLAPIIEKWSRGEKFSQLCSFTNIDEGEIVRYFRMVIQILRQLLFIPAVNKDFKVTIKDALYMINRDEIDAEKQLREGV